MMYTIGQFSQMVKIPCKTLRYYDEIGLLKPARTDYLNNYRYYDHQSVLQAQQLLVYKRCGLPLEKIRQIMSNETDGDDLKTILEDQIVNLERELTDIQKSLSRIREIIISLEENRMNEVQLKERPEKDVLAIRKRGGHDTIGEILSELFSAAAEYNLEIAGPHTIVWYEEKKLDSDDTEIEIYLPVKNLRNTAAPFAAKKEKQLVCSYIHTGDFSTVSSGYEKIHEYADAHGLMIIGAFEESYLSDIRKVRPAEFKTEISVPVRKTD